MPPEPTHPLSQALRPLVASLPPQPLGPGTSPTTDLMAWALETEQDRLLPHLRPVHKEWVEAMQTWPEDKVLQFLLRPHPDDPEAADGLTPADLKGLTPPQVAQQLLNLLHERLMTVDGAGYPPRHPNSRWMPT